MAILRNQQAAGYTKAQEFINRTRQVKTIAVSIFYEKVDLFAYHSLRTTASNETFGVHLHFAFQKIPRVLRILHS